MQARSGRRVPGLVENDGLSGKAEVDPRGLGTGVGVVEELLERAGVSFGSKLEGGNGAVGVAARGSVATNKNLDRRSGRGQTGVEKSSESHC